MGFMVPDPDGTPRYYTFQVMAYGCKPAVTIVMRLLRPIKVFLHRFDIKFTIYIDDGRISAATRGLCSDYMIFTLRSYSLQAGRFSGRRQHLIRKVVHGPTLSLRCSGQSRLPSWPPLVPALVPRVCSPRSQPLCSTNSANTYSFSDGQEVSSPVQQDCHTKGCRMCLPRQKTFCIPPIRFQPFSFQIRQPVTPSSTWQMVRSHMSPIFPLQTTRQLLPPVFENCLPFTKHLSMTRTSLSPFLHS